MEHTQNTPAVPLPLAPPARGGRRQALHQQYKNWLQGDLDRTFLLWLKQRFIERQTQRRRQVHARLTRTQADVLQLLPFLFHCNHPNLPGYLKDAPKGIYGYVPGRSERATLRRWAPAYRYSPGREAHIHAIFLMGSAGSVAHTRASDLDVWVCVDDKDIHTTQAKIDNLAKWAALHNVELQGFAVSTEQFTNRTSLVTTPLLLDEFYRSSCHLAGKLPLWMLVPPGANTNAEYNHQKQSIFGSMQMRQRDFIDFGPVTEFSSAEVSAAMDLELQRVLRTPDKSILKAALLLCYHRGTPPLSDQHKGKLADPDNEVAADPYILLIEYLQEHLRERMYLQTLKRAWVRKTSTRNGYLNLIPAWQDIHTRWADEDPQLTKTTQNRTLVEVVEANTEFCNLWLYLIRYHQQTANSTSNHREIEELKHRAHDHLAHTRVLLPGFEKCTVKRPVVMCFGGTPDTTCTLLENQQPLISFNNWVDALLWLHCNQIDYGSLEVAGALAPRLRNLQTLINKIGRHPTEPQVLFDIDSSHATARISEQTPDLLGIYLIDPVAPGNIPSARHFSSLTQAWPHLARRKPHYPIADFYYRTFVHRLFDTGKAQD